MADHRGASRRKDSKQMWEESERSRTIQGSRDSRDSRQPRARDLCDDRERDDRRRSYRSRSRERERGGRSSRGEGRDRDSNRVAARGGTHRDSDRSTAPDASSKHRGEISIYRRCTNHDADCYATEDDSRIRERRRSGSRGPRRSRSPRRDLGTRGGRDRAPREPNHSSEAYKNVEAHAPATAQDLNRMDVDKPISSPLPQQHTTSAGDSPSLPGNVKTTNTIENKYDEDIEVEVDPDVAAMQAMMGFGGFGSTQNKKVPGNNVSAVRKEKRTEYRQYMNRVGGFNRPLSPARD